MEGTLLSTEWRTKSTLEGIGDAGLGGTNGWPNRWRNHLAKTGGLFIGTGIINSHKLVGALIPITYLISPHCPNGIAQLVTNKG